MEMCIDACIYEDIGEFIAKKLTYVALAEGGAELLTHAAAPLQNVQ